MMSGIKKKLKELFPTINYIYGWVKHFRYYYYILRAPQMHSKALRLAQQKKSLKCVFFVVHYQTWKYDDVYHIMSRSDRFDPIILVCPSVNYGREIMLMHLRDSYNFFAFNDYNVLNSYDETNDRYVDVEKEIGPDIIFYTNPYKGLIDERYYIDNFRNTLTVYVPYAFNNNADHEFCQNLRLRDIQFVVAEVGHLGIVHIKSQAVIDHPEGEGVPRFADGKTVLAKGHIGAENGQLVLCRFMGVGQILLQLIDAGHRPGVIAL